ncbi:MAG: L-rhamnose mutarotase [Deltaproteobacteria bacterium]|jgi:L-rhamnose mutarotase|nr:L-rhamnose mutarotase [Deltaproteobacteria bacterium]
MKDIKRYCQALDLVDDPALISEYETMHKHIWPEVAANIRASGVVDMQIYRVGNRLFMIMDVDSSFSFEKADKLNKSNRRVQEWEELMWKFQLPTPWTPSGEKWILMEQIFSLSDQPGSNN